MKTSATMLVAMIQLVLPSLAQTSSQFSAQLSYAVAVPPNPTILNGRADGSLREDGLFISHVWVNQGIGSETVQLFRSTSAGELGTPLFSFDPDAPYFPSPSGGSSGYMFRLEQNLTPSQIADLSSGFYWINAASSEFANASIRGQLIAVPEPSNAALSFFGLAILVYLATRRRSEKPA